MVGELEFFPRATSATKEAAASTDKEALATSTIKEAATASTQDHHFIMAANNILTPSTDFLGDTGASHHIAHRLDYFSEIFPLLGVSKIHQVQGTITATHWGTIILEVDSSHGKKPLSLVVVDLAGLATPRSLGGESLFMGILDVHTRHS